MTTTHIYERRDTAANWTTKNPVLGPGEVGHETDTGWSKTGDGATAWNSLAYDAPRFLQSGTGAVARNAQDKSRDRVSVKDFGASATALPATNRAAIQSAITYALSITPHPAIEFSEIIDVTGGSITINKSPDYGDRNFLTFLGNGGGLKKTDSGFMFTASQDAVGDIRVRNMAFISTQGAGMIIWDANHLMRINSTGNEYYNVDCIARHDSTITAELFQSCRFSHEKIVGGSGYAFYWLRAADCSFQNCLVENRDSFVGNIQDVGGDVNLVQNHNIRVTDNCVEGLAIGEGTVLKWGNTWGCTIAHNYVESNLNYFDLNTLVRANHTGLRFENNALYLSSTQKSNGFQPVQVGNLRLLSTTTLRSHCSFFGGNVSDGELYNFLGTGKLNSFGDYANSQSGFNNANIVVNSGSNQITTAAGNNVTTSGVATMFQISHTETNMTAGEVRSVAIAFTDAGITNPIWLGNVYSIAVAQYASINVLSYYPVWSTANSGTFNVVLQNRSGGTVANVVLTITAIQVGS